MQKTTAILLALLLLLSTTGLTYGQHICGGKVVVEKITIGEKYLSCGPNEMPPAQKKSVDKPACCQNVYHKVETDSDYNGASFDFQPEITFVAAFVAVFVFQPAQDLETKIRPYSDYLPPPVAKDIPVLYQTFLI
jgi:hypothetical protein